MEVEKVIERLGKQIVEWEQKLEGFKTDVELAQKKQAKLEAERDKYIFAAKGEGKKTAQEKLDKVRAKLIEVEQEPKELAVLIEQTEHKIEALKAGLKDRLREFEVIELTKLKEKRFELAEKIEKQTKELIESLKEFKDIGDDMFSKAKKLGVSHQSIYSHRRAAYYLQGQLSDIFPYDFPRPLPKQRGSLVAIDQDTIEKIFDSHRLTLKTRKVS